MRSRWFYITNFLFFCYVVATSFVLISVGIDELVDDFIWSILKIAMGTINLVGLYNFLSIIGEKK